MEKEETKMEKTKWKSNESTHRYILFEKTKVLYTIIHPKLALFPKSPNPSDLYRTLKGAVCRGFGETELKPVSSETDCILKDAVCFCSVSEKFTLRQRIEELILDSIKLLIKQNYKTNDIERKELMLEYIADIELLICLVQQASIFKYISLEVKENLERLLKELIAIGTARYRNLSEGRTEIMEMIK